MRRDPAVARSRGERERDSGVATSWRSTTSALVGYRQWVLSFTGPLAVRLGYDRELLAAVR